MKVIINNPSGQQLGIVDIGVFKSGEHEYDLSKEQIEALKLNGMLKIKKAEEKESILVNSRLGKKLITTKK